MKVKRMPRDRRSAIRGSSSLPPRTHNAPPFALLSTIFDPAEVVKDVAFSGDAKRSRWRQTRRGAVIDLTVKGRAVVEAKL
jgi:hypothetical protein